MYKNDNIDHGIILFNNIGVQVLNGYRTVLIRFQDIKKIENSNLDNKRANDPFLHIHAENYSEKIFVDGNENNKTFDIFEFQRFFISVCKNLDKR